MHGLRALCAVLLLIGFTLGFSVQAATDWPESASAGQLVHAAHDHGAPKSAADHHSHKSHLKAICVTACCGVIAVLGIAPQLSMPVSRIAAFPPAAHSERAGAITIPEPFPPKPFRIA
jgi:hypothetical protein